MQTIEVNIRLDPFEDGISWMPKNVKMEGKHALVIGTNGKYRVIDEDEALEIMDKLSGCCRSDYMGKTTFLVVYNANKVIKTCGTSFIAGSVLIVKAGNNGMDFLDDAEIEKAKAEFAGRMVTLCADGVDFSAYEIG